MHLSSIKGIIVWINWLNLTRFVVQNNRILDLNPNKLSFNFSLPTDVLWPCHTLLGSPACLRKYLAIINLLTKYVFVDSYANNTNLLYQI